MRYLGKKEAIFLIGNILSLIVLTFSASANANLIGAEVNLSAYYPDSTTVYADGGNAVVSNAVEYPAGFIPTYNSIWQADITGTQLFLEWDFDLEGSFGIADFNGFILDILSGPTMVAASVDGASSIIPLDLSIQNGGTRLFLNYSGAEFPANSRSIINISTAAATVPTPAAIWLFGLGLGLLGWHRLKKIA